MNFINNKINEFDADLEDHEIKEGSIYRLYYLNYHRIGTEYGYVKDNVGVVDWPFLPFSLPTNMSREDAFSVLSYLSDYIEKESHLEPCSFESVSTLNEVLNIPRLGFKRVTKQVPEETIINLYTVTGRVLLFKQSKHYADYFEWYREGVTSEEVKKIYQKIGIDFYDLVPTTEKPKQLKK